MKILLLLPLYLRVVLYPLHHHRHHNSLPALAFPPFLLFGFLPYTGVEALVDVLYAFRVLRAHFLPLQTNAAFPKALSSSKKKMKIKIKIKIRRKKKKKKRKKRKEKKVKEKSKRRKESRPRNQMEGCQQSVQSSK